MSLSMGTRLGPYEILSPLGAGGMGEVYRARDTRLDRDVALKILPETFAAHADRMARFEREAKVLASLNHPNIAAIYGVEERALVMELVEGSTLAECVAKGSMPLDDALPILQQLIDALEYAHEKNIIHRDLKPANIKLTPEAKVKVLDFGLAKALTPDLQVGNPACSPTVTMRSTVAGTILGTAAYMSPEQARGQAVDKRSDIWAFGVVVYEMVTGKALFAGPTISDTLAAVLKGEPDVTGVPATVRPIVERCLRKDARQRWRDIGDVRVALEEGVPAADAPRRSVWPWAIAAVLAVVVTVLAGALWRATRPDPHPLTRLSVDLGPEATMGPNITAVISPDGRRLVFPARGPDGKQQLATRLLDQAQTTLLPSTESGVDPFFSPDGQWIGFFVSGQLKKISVHGGAPVTLCTVTLPQGASWGEDGNIVAALNNLAALFRIPAAGGTPQRLTKLGVGEITHRWPQVLPGGEAVLFTASPTTTGLDSANIEAVSMKTGQVKLLQRGGYYGRYVPSGHLVYVHQGRLFGVGFDVGRLEVRGTPTPLLEDVAANPSTGGGQFAFSGAASWSGTLVYLAGKAAAQTWQVAWLDSSGKMQPLIRAPGEYTFPRFSPDGRKLAFNNGTDIIYIHDLERDTAPRLTFNVDGRVPVWTPDGKHIAFSSVSGGFSVSWIRSDGAGEPQRLLESQDAPVVPWSFSPDGRRLAYVEVSPETGYDIWTLPLDLTDPSGPKRGKPEPFLRTPADESIPRFSPDGHWIAYKSNETGNNEIYVRPFPAGGGGKWQISAGGGLYTFWSKNGRELFYETTDNRIMVVDYTLNGDSFVPGKPRLWSDKQIFYSGLSNLDLAPDGKRFVVQSLPEAAGGERGTVHVTMLLNFFDELKRKLP